MSSEILLKIEKVSKHFAGIHALYDVDFTLHAGEVMALAGHNGAGKSVLCKIMGGFYQPDSGSIYFGNRKVSLHSPHDAQKMGFYMVPQELTIAKQLSVADNIFLGRDGYSGAGGMVSNRKKNKQAHALLHEYFGIDINPSTAAGELDTVTQRLIQVVRCLDAGAKIIVFDETTAGLAQHERDVLFDHIRKLAQKGLGIVFISHIISEMTEIADKVTVLRGGNLVAVRKMSDVSTTELIELIVGKEMQVQVFEKPVPQEQTALSVSGLSTQNGVLSDISFEVKKGEIVGIYGLRDQGQKLLLETVFGAYKKSSGDISIKGKPVQIASPEDALQNGLEYLPDRGGKSVFRNKSILENLIVQTQNHREKGFFYNLKAERAFAAEVVEKYGVRGFDSLDSDLGQLSGGNMQKILIARSMTLDPDIIMFTEPTEGIDIGAKEEVKKIIVSAAMEGKGVLIATSELDDIIGICNRVIIIRDHKIKSILDASETNKGFIMEQSIG